MGIPSPFEGLHLGRELVCEFFAVFARIEFSLKELGYCRDNHGIVAPAWRAFAEVMASEVVVEMGSGLHESIIYLIGNPPLVQVGARSWEHQRLYGGSEFAQAIDAATRVRHNLFHGGKHTPHSPAGRDELLVKSALVILHACIERNKELRETYVQNIF